MLYKILPACVGVPQKLSHDHNSVQGRCAPSPQRMVVHTHSYITKAALLCTAFVSAYAQLKTAYGTRDAESVFFSFVFFWATGSFLNLSLHLSNARIFYQKYTIEPLERVVNHYIYGTGDAESVFIIFVMNWAKGKQYFVAPKAGIKCSASGLKGFKRKINILRFYYLFYWTPYNATSL